MSDWEIVYQRIERVRREDASNGIVVASRVAINTDGIVNLPMLVAGLALVAYQHSQAVYEVV